MTNSSPAFKPLLYIGAIVLAGVLGSLSIIYADSQYIFRVKSIEIMGQREVSNKEIVDLANIQRGLQIFDLNVEDHAMALREHPYIWNARMSVIYPDKVLIEVFERIPEVLVELDRIYALDRFATLLPKPRDISDLPVITGLSSSPHTDIGEKITHSRVREGLFMVTLSGRNFPLISDHLTELHWEKSENSWIAIFDNSRKPLIYLGDSGLEDKLNILSSYLKTLDDEGRNFKKLTYLDLRFKDQVVVQ